MAKRLITVPWVSLVNLIAEREVVPEVVQHHVVVDDLVRQVGPDFRIQCTQWFIEQ